MSLEKDIKQKGFGNLCEKTLVNIMFTSNTIQQELKQIFKSFDLTGPQYNILRILKGSHPNVMSPGDIKEVMITSGADVTRLIDRMVSKKIVSRVICPSNRRKMEIGITVEGMKMLDMVYPKLQNLFNKVGAKLSDKEAKLINNALDKMRTLL